MTSSWGPCLPSIAAPVPGATYVIFGKTNLPAVIDLENNGQDLLMIGQEGDWMNGRMRHLDGGFQRGRNCRHDPSGQLGGGDHGRAYLVYGSKNLSGTLNFSQTDEDVRIIAATGNKGLTSERSLLAGDINGDGVDDILVGASRMDASGRYESGGLYVIFGKTPYDSATSWDTEYRG